MRRPVAKKDAVGYIYALELACKYLVVPACIFGDRGAVRPHPPQPHSYQGRAY